MSTPMSAIAPTVGGLAPSAKSRSLSLALVGSGGDGVALLGDLLLRIAARQGLYGVMVQSYGPQIRGGESAAILRIAEEPVEYEGDHVDLLLCFRNRDLSRFRGTVQLHPHSLVLLEATDQAEAPEWLGRSENEPWRYPFARFDGGVEIEGEPKNMMGLALVCRALGWPDDMARKTVERRFASRPDLVARNLGAFDSAWAASESLPRLPALRGKGVSLEIESGNEAMARGAIASGLEFFAGYPITPSSEILETLIDELPVAGGTVVQAEDEIAALGMVLGASFGGLPAMTATSGPGLSLMTEMMGLASMAELPAVIVDCQRVGPATGMPSRTEQSDLDHAIYGGHGDFPRVVMGVFDVVHARDVMRKAFGLAEKWQLPVLVLSDAYIAQRRQIRDRVTPVPRPPRRVVWEPGQSPARFQLDLEHGVAPFRVPGTVGGTYLAAGIEHTPEGNPTADTTLHHQMNAKRFRKLDGVAEETRDGYRTLGRPDAPLGIVAWGSLYGLLREWVREHTEYQAFLPETIKPLPSAALRDWLAAREWAAVIELSFQGQFHRYLGTMLDMNRYPSLRRSGGVPLGHAELETMLKEARP